MTASTKLSRADLWSLEDYASERPAFREKVLEHKKHRQLLLGDHLLLIFEDTLTIRYQIQEMLRIERIFEAAGIQDELDAYNPLIPDGRNWKCTLLIQYPDVEERQLRLKELVGIEEAIWVRVGSTEPVTPVADEDMDRTNDTKTAAVHFLRFELGDEQISAVRAGEPIVFGVTHSAYPDVSLKIEPGVAGALVQDLA